MKVSSLLYGIAAVVLGASASLAQQTSAISHGSWLVGGTAGLMHTSTGGTSTTAVSFLPMGLYFFADRLALGGTLALGHTSSSTGNVDFHSTVIGAEPTIRYFFGDLTGKLFPYLNGAVGPSWERAKSDGGTSSAEQTTTGLDLTASAGLMRMLATHVGLSGEVFYTHSHRSADTGPATLSSNADNYGLRFGFNAFVF